MCRLVAIYFISGLATLIPFDPTSTFTYLFFLSSKLALALTEIHLFHSNNIWVAQAWKTWLTPVSSYVQISLHMKKDFFVIVRFFPASPSTTLGLTMGIFSWCPRGDKSFHLSFSASAIAFKQRANNTFSVAAVIADHPADYSHPLVVSYDIHEKEGSWYSLIRPVYDKLKKICKSHIYLIPCNRETKN